MYMAECTYNVSPADSTSGLPVEVWLKLSSLEQIPEAIVDRVRFQSLYFGRLN